MKDVLTNGELKKSLKPALSVKGKAIATPEGQDRTLCLVMIVKDEEDCIEKCLESVVQYISYWIICDTGSSDRTIDTIYHFMQKHKVPGKLYKRKWFGYDVNRNESLSLSFGICDYRLLMDADDYLKVNKEVNPFSVLSSDLDCYDISIISGSLEWKRAVIINSKQAWNFNGIIHEYLSNPDKKGKSARQYIDNCMIMAGLSSKRKYKNQQEKYEKDAQLLEIGLQREPDNKRYMFYLAQSYFYADKLELSKEAYIKRIEMEGWEEEVYYSKLMLARLSRRMEENSAEIINNYSLAYEYRPSRLEAAFELMFILFKQRRYRLAYMYGNAISHYVENPCSDTLFVEQSIWQWKFYDLFSAICSLLRLYDLAVILIGKIISSPYKASIPKADIERIERNMLNFSESSKQFKV